MGDVGVPKGIALEDLLHDLRHTELNVSEIGARHGVTPSAVSFRVKKGTGMTPGVWRVRVAGWLSRSHPPYWFDRIVECYATGLSVRQVMAATGVSELIVCRALRLRGVPLHTRRYFADDQAAEIAQRYRAGETAVQIAASLGIAERTVRRYLDEQGVVRRPPGTRSVVA